MGKLLIAIIVFALLNWCSGYFFGINEVVKSCSVNEHYSKYGESIKCKATEQVGK